MLLFASLFLSSCHLQPAPQVIIKRGQFSQLNLATPIKLLNWNIAKKNQLATWQQDLKEILTTLQPDLLLIQEALIDIHSKDVFTLKQRGWYFAPNLFNPYQQTYAGVLTASHAEALTAQSLITRNFEPAAKTPKTSLITEYALAQSEQTLWVTNVHAINFVSIDKFTAQLQQLEQKLRQHSGPLIMAGDFNTWNQTRLSLLTQMAKRLQLQLLCFTPQDQAHIRHFLLSPPLDHIFYRGVYPYRSQVLMNIFS
ncbi:MAG: endonuclease/exonuclease/phosphatase family protein, partial [Pseudomonadota bacterium]|nr:endonuclease/exonuclease/phosphatase family protein [Pseudomonadota bacterium]